MTTEYAPREEVAHQISSADFSEKSAFKQFLGSLFGFDFFISYAWADGRDYAVELAERLEREVDGKKCTCFLDSEDYSKGDDWKEMGHDALQKTSILILVASPRALQSEPVLREVRIYTERKNRVIPIEFVTPDGAGTLDPIRHPSKIHDFIRPEILRIREPLQFRGDVPTQLVGPSDEVVQQIRGSFDLITQSDKRARIFGIAALVFAVVAMLALVFWRTAEANKQEAYRATRIAERNLETAQSQRDAALTMIRQTMFATQDELAQTPRLQPLQQRIAKLLLDGLQSMSDNRLSDDALTHYECLTQIDIAKLMTEVGSVSTTGNSGLEQAEVSLVRVVEQLARLTKSHPQNAQYHRDLSYGCNELGEVQLSVGKEEAALENFERGLKAIERAVEIAPLELTLKRDVMWSYMKLGDYYQFLADNIQTEPGDAQLQNLRRQQLEWFEKAGQVGEELQRISYDAAAWEIGAAWDRLCDGYLQSGQFDRGLDCAQRVEKLRREILESNPENKEARRNYGVALDKLGAANLELGHGSEAVKHFMASLELSKELLQDDPKGTDLGYDLAKSYDQLAVAYYRQADLSQALSQLKESIRIYAELVLKEPRSIEFLNDLTRARVFAGQLLLNSGSMAEARQMFQEALDRLVSYQQQFSTNLFEDEIALLRQLIAECGN